MVARLCTALLAVSHASCIAAHVIGVAPEPGVISASDKYEAQINAPSGHFGMTLKKKDRVMLNATTSRSLQSRDEFAFNIKSNWLAVLDVGTPPQTLELLLDLGSDGFVVESDLLPPDKQTTKFPIYHPAKSTSAQHLEGYSWEYFYVGATLKGDVYNDVVTMGERTWDNFSMEVVTGQPLGTPVEQFSGILGLAAHLIAPVNPVPVPSFLGAIMNQLKAAVFTLWFDPVAKEGSIEFGVIDDTKYTGEIAYAPLYNERGTTFWSLNISGIGAADPKTGALLHSVMTPFTAILDTGSGTSMLPNESLWGYYGGIPGSIFDDGGGCYDYDCSVDTALPDLVLFIGDKPVVVPRNSYGYWQSMNPANGKAGVDYCTAHVRPNWFNGGGNVIGADILEGVFLALDWGNQQIGFANSTAMAADASFSIPQKPGKPSCSYATSKPTVKPAITGCTGRDFGGSCSQIPVSHPGCTILDPTLSLASVQPLEDSNLRCTFHSGDNCNDPLSDATGLTYPGANSLNQSPRSVSCVSVGTEPNATPASAMITCGEGSGNTSGCFFDGISPWACSVLFNPPELFKWDLKSLWTDRTNGNKAGTCFFFQDMTCSQLVSPTQGVDMCNSDSFGDHIDVAFGTYVGSYMCI